MIPLLAQVAVHIESDQQVSLERAFVDELKPNRPRWVTICSSPCDRVVGAGMGYRIVGDGVRSSQPFAIDGRNVNLVVDPASKGTFVGGLVTLGVGGGAALLGIGLLALSQQSHSSEPRDQTLPVTLAIGGGVVALVGAVILLGSKTTVTLQRKPSVSGGLLGSHRCRSGARRAVSCAACGIRQLSSNGCGRSRRSSRARRATASVRPRGWRLSAFARDSPTAGGSRAMSR